VFLVPAPFLLVFGPLLLEFLLLGNCHVVPGRRDVRVRDGRSYVRSPYGVGGIGAVFSYPGNVKPLREKGGEATVQLGSDKP